MKALATLILVCAAAAVAVVVLQGGSDPEPTVAGTRANSSDSPTEQRAPQDAEPPRPPLAAAKLYPMSDARSDEQQANGSFSLMGEGYHLNIQAQLSGLIPGEHALHILEASDCRDIPEGPRQRIFNPDGVPHGQAGQSGSRVGALGNVKVNDDGAALVSVLARETSLDGGPHSVADRVIVLREKPDDFQSEPDGAAGRVVACAQIAVQPPPPATTGAPGQDHPHAARAAGTTPGRGSLHIGPGKTGRSSAPSPGRGSSAARPGTGQPGTADTKPMGETSSEVAQQAPPPPQPEQIQPVAQGDSDTEFAPPTSATLPDGVAEDGSEAVGPGGFPVQPDPGEGPGFTLPENE